MKRRDFLKTSAFAAAMPWLPMGRNDSFGWIPGDTDLPSLSKVARTLTNFGEGKVACLWKPFEQLVGPWPTHRQVGPDCVAHASGSAMDLLTAIQIVLRNTSEQWVAESSTNMIYSAGRELFGGGGSAGMRGIWAMKYLNRYGNLLRQQYPDYDLTEYNKATYNYWNSISVPESLLNVAKEHPLLSYAPVRTWEEFRDAVAAGYPVTYCASMYGGYDQRDKDGFINTRSRRKWYHAWLGAGIDDGKRPGACLINSHGTGYGSGPTRHDSPVGAVWVDAKVIDKHCRNFADSYALSVYRGFPKPEEEYILW